MTDTTRRDFLKLAAATGAALAVPIVVAEQVLSTGGFVRASAMPYTIGEPSPETYIGPHLTIDTEKMWQMANDIGLRGFWPMTCRGGGYSFVLES